MSANTAVIGVDIGGTKISIGTFNEAGAALGPKTVVPTPAGDGPTAIVPLIQSIIASHINHGTPIGAIGVGSAGVIDRAGKILSSTDAITGWAGFDLQGALSVFPGIPVTVINDVHAAAVGERALGAARTCRSFLMATIGTGVGGAIVLDGVLHLGRTGTAGSVGHTNGAQLPNRRCSCGESGHVEAYASGPAMEKAYFHRTGQQRSLVDIAANAEAGDSTSKDVIREGATALGHGLASIINVLDTDAVVLGGGVMRIGPSYLDQVRASMQNHALPGPSTIPVVAAELGVEATMIGSALHALTHGNPTRRK